jgi:hypothetical protein
MSLSRKAILLSLDLPVASPSSSSPSNKPSMNPGEAHVPGSPAPAPLITARRMSWMKRKGGLRRSFSESRGLEKRGCSISAVRCTSPVAPHSLAERNTLVKAATLDRVGALVVAAGPAAGAGATGTEGAGAGAGAGVAEGAAPPAAAAELPAVALLALATKARDCAR